MIIEDMKDEDRIKAKVMNDELLALIKNMGELAKQNVITIQDMSEGYRIMGEKSIAYADFFDNIEQSYRNKTLTS